MDPVATEEAARQTPSDRDSSQNDFGFELVVDPRPLEIETVMLQRSPNRVDRPIWTERPSVGGNGFEHCLVVQAGAHLIQTGSILRRIPELQRPKQ